LFIALRFRLFQLTGGEKGEGRENQLKGEDLLFKVACFVRKINNIFNIKSSRSKLVSSRRSTVLAAFPLSKGSLERSPAVSHCDEGGAVSRNRAV
jgi:hypothetical protein